MMKKSTLTVALSMLFALTVALPVSATTTETDTTTVTADAAVQTTVDTVDKKTVFEQLVARKKAELAEMKAKRGTSTKATTTPRTLGTALKTVDASCIVELVDAREVSIQNAWATFNTSMADALKARHSALVAAWGNADLTARVQGIKTAMKTWRDAHKKMFTKLKTERKSAWGTFKSEAKSECKVTVPAEEKLTADASGSVSL